jgi:hypothetical protein
MKPLFILLLVIFCINISKQNSNIKPLNEQKAQTVALLECILGGDTFLKYFDNIMNSIEYKNTFKIIETVVSGFPENFKFMKKCYEDTKTEEKVIIENKFDIEKIISNLHLQKEKRVAVVAKKL